MLIQILVGQLWKFEWNEPQEEARDKWGNLPSRPVHVEVDGGAWTQLRAALVEDRKGVGYTVGRLIRDAVGRRRFIREDDEQSPDIAGRRAKVFIRLQDVDDAIWRGFKATAMEHHVTAARLIGLVIEAEARRRGHWQGY